MRLWAIWDVLDNEHNALSVCVLQSYQSGQHYSLTGEVDTVAATSPTPATTTRRRRITYYFSDRGTVHLSKTSPRTDLSLNYSFLWDAFGRQIEVFLQPEVLNVFDEQGLVDFDTRIRTVDEAKPRRPATARRASFDPFTETPVEGVNWAKRATFGQALAENDYQDPREFRFSVGFRF